MNGSIFDTFAYFRRIDTEPRMQRKLLLAINQRHMTVVKQRPGAIKVVQDVTGKR